MSPDGILLIDKPAGVTSHDVVSMARRALHTRKIGHAGTLDPMATGLLVLGVGRATRLLRYLSGLDKTYEATALLGVTTDTLDAEGTVTAESDAGAITPGDVAAVAERFVGTISQVPPAYSAIKVGGEASYKAARRGEDKELPPRQVTIDRLEIDASQLPQVAFVMDCSSGTYVRTLAADIGEALGCGAHLTSLRRTRIGPFALDEAVPADAIAAPLPIERAVAHLPRFELSEHEAEAASHGRPLVPTGIVGSFGVYGPSGRLVAMYRDDGAKSIPEMVLAPLAEDGPEGAQDAGLG